MSNDRGLTDLRRPNDAIDDLIRRRFRACDTLPLFAEPPAAPALPPPEFFEPPHVGRQLRLTDAWQDAR